MNPWLIGILVWLGLLALAWLFFAGVAVVESICAKWEEDEIRRIKRGYELRHAARAGQSDDLPANWRELDGAGSFEEAWAEMRRRKTGSA